MQQGSEPRPAPDGVSLTDVLERATRAAIAGQDDEATRLFERVWTEGAAPEAMSAAAWGLGWLALRARAYPQAAIWFGRADAWPAEAAGLWPLIQRLLIDHCGALTTGDLAPTAAPPRLPPLKITHMGGFQIERGGESMPGCPARKATAVLRYLLTRRQLSAHRDELMELFWPEAGPHEAAHSLHVAIAALRRYLDPPGASYLRFDLGHYSIDPNAAIDDDARRFQEATERAERLWRAGAHAEAQQHYLHAVACYVGDYFVDERDTSWAIAEREQLLARYLTALDRLGRIFVAQQRFELAAECFQALLGRDIYREDAHGRLMACYAALGRRSDALRQYEACRAALKRDLGIEPAGELRACYERIAAGGAAEGDALVARAIGQSPAMP